MFNNERPHEGLNNQMSSSLYRASTVRPPRKLPEHRYPTGLLLRRVNNSGDINWHKTRIFNSEVFRFEELGLEFITLDSTASTSAIWILENWMPKNPAFMLRAVLDEAASRKAGHGSDRDIYLVVTYNLNHSHCKGVVTDVSGPQRNACPGTLTPLAGLGYRFCVPQERRCKTGTSHTLSKQIGHGNGAAMQSMETMKPPPKLHAAA